MDYKKEFKKRKKLQYLVPITACILAIVLFIADIRPVAILCIIGAVVFSMVNWRCPKCKQYLGRGTNPTHCSNCGTKLQ